MNVIDKMVAVINPVRALEREKARCRLGIIQKFYNSGYDEGGASHDKNSMRGWRASSKSPQEDIDRNLDTLRQRSRSLMMSAPGGRRRLRQSSGSGARRQKDA